jgi:putative ABC transport system ATP-binding protein
MMNSHSKIDALFTSAASEKRSGYVIRSVDVKRVYKMGDSETHALRGVTLDIERGEYMSIMGPSGSGKSTYFNMIGGLDKPSSGKVYIDQVDIAQLNPQELAWLRCRKVGYIFQSFNLIQVMSCIENVMLPMAFAGLDAEESREKAMDILEKVGLGDRALHKPQEMSGGQQQRVAIARSLANSPDILLADEPTGNLDLRTGEEIIELFVELRNTLGVTIISATHDLKMLKASDRIVWIDDGLVTKVTTPDEMDISVAEMH